ELEYERLSDEFNAPPLAKFHLIWVRGNDDDARDEVQRRLDAGEPFLDVAASKLNTFRRNDAGAVERTLESARAETDFFNERRFPNLNAAAQTLEPGAVAGPISDGDGPAARTSWLLLDEIIDNSTTLYEEQERLSNAIRNRKVEEKGLAFVVSLMERASFTSIDEMSARLMDIVVERHRPELAGNWQPFLAAVPASPTSP
ncbi:MAG: hypothetical protein AAGK04_10585, partial [Planctomycetota bacterium]